MCLTNVVAMGVSELGGDDGGGVTNGVSDTVELTAVVTVGDPHGLAVAEAGGRGEAHRVSVGCFEILQGQGVGGQYPNQTKNSPASTGPNLAVVP